MSSTPSIPLDAVLQLVPLLQRRRDEMARPTGGARLAQPADVTGIEDLDRVAAAERLRDVTGRIRALEAEQQALVAHWGDLHAPGPDADLSGNKDRVSGERFLPAGPAGMRVSEFAAPTLGALLGLGSWAAGSMIDDALLQRHRHPRLAELVRAGKVPVWAARRVVSATARAEVTDEDALAVDAATAADFARLPFPRAEALLTAALLRAPSSTLVAQQRAAQERKYAKACRSNDAGMKVFIAQLTAAGVARVDAMVTHLADRLAAMGDTRPVDVRRAAAFLLLADPAQACLLLAGHAAPDLIPDNHTDETPSDGEAAPGRFAPSDASHLDDTPVADADEDPATGTWERPTGPGAYGSWEFREDRAWPFTFPRRLDLSDDLPDDPTQEPGTAFVIAAAQAVGHALHDLGTRLGGTLWDRLRPRSVLYLHGWHQPPDHTDADHPGSPVGDLIRVEGAHGPLLADTIRDWLGHARVEVRPVIDTTTHLSADAYEVPPHIREVVRLRHPFEEFPHGRQASASCDQDHLRTFDHRPPVPPGQSGTENLQPLGRRHHRTKTHSTWQVHPLTLDDGLRIGALWRAPTGHWFRVDHLGTHDLGRPVDLERPA